MLVSVLSAVLVNVFQEDSPEQEEEEEEQEKEDSGEELQTAFGEGVKNSICNNSHQAHNASKDDAGERSELVNTDPSSSSININAQ